MAAFSGAQSLLPNVGISQKGRDQFTIILYWTIDYREKKLQNQSSRKSERSDDRVELKVIPALTGYVWTKYCLGIPGAVNEKFIRPIMDSAMFFPFNDFNIEVCLLVF